MCFLSWYLRIFPYISPKFLLKDFPDLTIPLGLKSSPLSLALNLVSISITFPNSGNKFADIKV